MSTIEKLRSAILEAWHGFETCAMAVKRSDKFTDEMKSNIIVNLNYNLKQKIRVIINEFTGSLKN